MAKNNSIAVSVRDDSIPKNSTIKNTSQAFNKEMELLNHQLALLRKQKKSLMIKTEKTKKALKETEIAFSDLGQFAGKGQDKDLQKANKAYAGSNRELKLVSDKVSQTEKKLADYRKTGGMAERSAGVDGSGPRFSNSKSERDVSAGGQETNHPTVIEENDLKQNLITLLGVAMTSIGMIREEAIPTMLETKIPFVSEAITIFDCVRDLAHTIRTGEREPRQAEIDILNKAITGFCVSAITGMGIALIAGTPVGIGALMAGGLISAMSAVKDQVPYWTNDICEGMKSNWEDGSQTDGEEEHTIRESEAYKYHLNTYLSSVEEYKNKTLTTDRYSSTARPAWVGNGSWAGAAWLRHYDPQNNNFAAQLYQSKHVRTASEARRSNKGTPKLTIPNKVIKMRNEVDIDKIGNVIAQRMLCAYEVM